MKASDSRTIAVSAPILAAGPALWFSVYAPGWGYRAFALPCSTAYECLGAYSQHGGDLLYAFESGEALILRAVRRKAPSRSGERVVLLPGDFIEEMPGRA